MQISDGVCFTFDDLLLEPQYSEIPSRSFIDISCDLGERFSMPVVASPMSTVTGEEMSRAFSSKEMLSIVHRYQTIQEQWKAIANSYGKGGAIGITGDYLDRASALINEGGAKFLCIDVAHGHTAKVGEAITQLRSRFWRDDIKIMAGSIATVEGFQFLADHGVNIVRAGVGGGSICSTRKVAATGVPQAYMIKKIADYKKSLSPAHPYKNIKLLADGGIQNSGDIIKALALGADAVMVGSLIAGTTETPGQIFNAPDGKQYKVYAGMASEAQEEAFFGEVRSREGISTTVPFKGPVGPLLDALVMNIRAGLSYSGANNIKELQEKAKFIFQSEASRIESFTHILLR
jgi:IMP dehydrogenase